MGFCGETEADHAETLDLIERVGFDQAFLFAYSERSQTHAARHLQVHLPLLHHAGALPAEPGWLHGPD